MIIVQVKNYIMIKLSKKMLFVLIVLMAIFTAISYFTIDWNIFNMSTKDAIKELRLTVIFFIMCIYFIFPYVKKIKE